MIALLHSRYRVSACVLVFSVVMLPDTARAEIDFSAGKNAEKLFSSDCSECHRSPSNMTYGRSAPALAAFLREHYTTHPQRARLLASYLVHARASNSTVHKTENSVLKIFWATWRKIHTAWWWLVGQITTLSRI